MKMARHRRSSATQDSQDSEEALQADSEPLAEIHQLKSDLSREFTLARPVRVEIWMEHGEYVADAAELSLHAFGVTRTEALANLSLQIVEQRNHLLALRDRLSPLMRQEAAQLEAIVLPRNA